MPPVKPLHCLCAGLTLAVWCFPTPAMAADQLTIMNDQSTLLALPDAPGTVVVGNPSIADATMAGKSLFLHGRSFGQTNLILLDKQGNLMKEYLINVAYDDPDGVVMFKPGLRQSFSCAPNCESTIQIGDTNGWVKQVHENFNLKTSVSRDLSAPEPD